MTVAEHVSLVEAFKPDAFEALCDSASSLSNKPKRIKKSVDRTLSFLDQTLALRAESQVNRWTVESLSLAGDGCELLGVMVVLSPYSSACYWEPFREAT